MTIRAAQIDSAEVLNTKNVLVAKRTDTTLATGTGSTLSSNALISEIVSNSTSGMTGGGSSTDGIVTSAPGNISQLRNSAMEAIQSGSNEQIYSRITASTAAQGGTSSWNGTTTVSMTDTTGVAPGDFIGATTTGPWFEITAETSNVSVIITNPNGFTIPSSGSSVYKLTMTLSFFKLVAGTETAHTMGTSADIYIKFPESHGLAEMPFQAMDEFGAFPEIIDTNVTASEVTVIDTFDNSASTILQTILDDFDTAITSAAATGYTPHQEAVTAQTITGTDTALTDTLNTAPVSSASVLLFLNGVFQKQGAGFDYTISG
jgi:hypothetical protein